MGSHFLSNTEQVCLKIKISPDGKARPTLKFFEFLTFCCFHKTGLKFPVFCNLFVDYSCRDFGWQKMIMYWVIFGQFYWIRSHRVSPRKNIIIDDRFCIDRSPLSNLHWSKFQNFVYFWNFGFFTKNWEQSTR